MVPYKKLFFHPCYSIVVVIQQMLNESGELKDQGSTWKYRSCLLKRCWTFLVVSTPHDSVRTFNKFKSLVIILHHHERRASTNLFQYKSEKKTDCCPLMDVIGTNPESFSIRASLLTMARKRKTVNMPGRVCLCGNNGMPCVLAVLMRRNGGRWQTISVLFVLFKKLLRTRGRKTVMEKGEKATAGHYEQSGY